jgi:multiple sugar transport system permease protein
MRVAKPSLKNPTIDAAIGQAIPEQRTRMRKRAYHRTNNWIGYLLISPWLIGFFVFTLIPILASLYLAFTDYRLIADPHWIGTANFERMFNDDPRYWKSVQATFTYVLTAVPLRLAFALGIAMLLNTGRRFLSFYRAAFYAPSIIGGSIAVAIMWRQIFGTEGLVNVGLAFLGLPTTAWLGDPTFAIWTIVLLAAWQFGSPMLIFLAGLKQIPRELYESSSIDGAGPLSKFVSITLPMLSPVILFNLVMQVISGFMIFTQALVITNGGPLDTTLFYALYLYQRAFVIFQMGYSSAMAWVLLLIIAVFTAIIFKFSNNFVYYEERGY